MAGATQFWDDGRPNNAGRKPSGFATIGRQGPRGEQIDDLSGSRNLTESQRC